MGEVNAETPSKPTGIDTAKEIPSKPTPRIVTFLQDIGEHETLGSLSLREIGDERRIVVTKYTKPIQSYGEKQEEGKMTAQTDFSADEVNEGASWLPEHEQGLEEQKLASVTTGLGKIQNYVAELNKSRKG